MTHLEQKNQILFVGVGRKRSGANTPGLPKCSRTLEAARLTLSFCLLATSVTSLGRPIQVIGTMSDNKGNDVLFSFSLQATRAIHEMLLVPSHQGEVQTFFAPLFVVLLFQISFLVTKENTVAPDELNETEHVDSVRYRGPWASVLGAMLWPPVPWHLH